jgi:DNA-binding PadR family transcriptional regulator
LKELEGKGLVKCLTPNEKLGRIYTLTELGKLILEML